MDTGLVERAQRGDREAFGLLAPELATKFLAVSRGILRDLDLAVDATQQALVAIWRGAAATSRSGSLRRLVVPASRARLLCRGPALVPLAAENIGYNSWSACLTEDHLIVVVLTNFDADIFDLARPLVMAARSD